MINLKDKNYTERVVSMKIITEEMRFRKRLCEFALKNGLEKSIRFTSFLLTIKSNSIILKVVNVN